MLIVVKRFINIILMHSVFEASHVGRFEIDVKQGVLQGCIIRKEFSINF